MNLILALEEKTGLLGVDGKLPWDLPADRMFFRKHTEGRILIMGSKTYESVKTFTVFNDGSRVSWVLSSTRPDLTISDISDIGEHVRYFNSIDDLLSTYRLYVENGKAASSFVIIGGSHVAAQFLEMGLIDRALITWVTLPKQSEQLSQSKICVSINPVWFAENRGFKKIEDVVPLTWHGDITYRTVYYESSC